MLLRPFEDAGLFETRTYKQIAYLEELQWIVGTPGKLKQEMQLLSEYNDLGKQANPHSVSGYSIEFVFV